MRNRQAAFQIRHLLPPGLFFCLFLAACSPKPLQSTPQPATLTPRASLTASPTVPTQTPSPTASPTLDPTPICNGLVGQVMQVEFDTTRMYEPFKMSVYLPPCYTLYLEKHYPVLYLFHGIYYSNDQWIRLGVTRVADRLINSGEIPPFIIVMPYDSNAREPTNSAFDEVFIQEAVSYIDANYRTIPQAAGRAVGGLSRGAGWAIHFGLTHPELFGAIGAHSPVLFWEDAPELDKWLAAIPRSGLPRISLDIGDRDPNRDSAELLENALTDKNIPFDLHLNSGYHTEEYWSQHVEDYIRWYAAGW